MADTRPLPISKVEFIAILTLLSVITAFSIDFLIPAMDEIRTDFNMPKQSNATALLISLFFIAMALSQLVFGILADRFGRRPLLYLALAIYLIASFLAIFSPTFHVLLIARFAQGLGAGACRVLSMAVIRDYFRGEAMAKLMSIIMAFFILFPIIAPPLGALVLLYWPWQACFVIFVWFGIITLVWCHFRLKESLPSTDHRPLQISSIIGGFKQIFSHRQTFAYMMIVAMTFCGFSAYLGSAQVLFEEIYGQSVALWFSILACAMGLAFVLNNRLIDWLGFAPLTHYFIVINAVCCTALLLTSLTYGGTPPFALFVTLFALIGFAVCIIFPNANSLAMEPMGHMAGTAAAIIGFVTTVIGAVAGQFISSFITSSLLPFALGWFIASSITIVLLLFPSNRKHPT